MQTNKLLVLKMTENHSFPITTPPELVKQWIEDWYRSKVKHTDIYSFLAIRAAQWGADQELQACGEWLMLNGYGEVISFRLRIARRPKPPSLKEQALLALSHLLDGAAHSMDTTEPADYIRRALEQLDD
jgi:hypothetical protein